MAREREDARKAQLQKDTAKFFNTLISKAPKGKKIEPPADELKPYEGEDL